MSQRVSTQGEASRGSLTSIAAFLVGLPLGIAILWLIQKGPWQDPELVRYTSHPVEMAEIMLFCCAMTALGAKLLAYMRDRFIFTSNLLPKWDGKIVQATEAASLLTHLNMQSGWRGTWLGRRVHAVLDFVHSRRSANELDDQLRTLADNDAMSQEGSYSLLRFINWAIPILGFLGTVLGITDAIANVDPSVLEKSLSGVTSGLATAFDTTAVALFLTMILMFATFTCERLEQGTLEQVDAYVEKNLAHRFERTGADAGPFVKALQEHTQLMLNTTGQLVEKQSQIWSRSLELAETRWNNAIQTQQNQMAEAIGQALTFALTRHGERLAELETKLIARSQALIDGVSTMAKVLQETNEQHRQSLGEIVQRMSMQAETLARVQDGEAHLIRLQDSLQNNLNVLANTGSFDEAVQSLTAAIHLLTSRVQPVPMIKKAA